MTAKFKTTAGTAANTNLCGQGSLPGRHIAVIEARTATQLAATASLMRDFIEWCRTRYAARVWAVERYFQPAAVEKELAALGQAYAAPRGAILMAMVNDLPAGCVAFRTIGEGVCEMKRLFIRSPFQGLGLGRMLCEELIATARRRGFRTMRLETGDNQPEALALYRALGFVEIAPYYDPPEDLRPMLIFMERML